MEYFYKKSLFHLDWQLYKKQISSILAKKKSHFFKAIEIVSVNLLCWLMGKKKVPICQCHVMLRNIWLLGDFVHVPFFYTWFFYTHVLRGVVELLQNGTIIHLFWKWFLIPKTSKDCEWDKLWPEPEIGVNSDHNR